jgi:hypothetical protein
MGGRKSFLAEWRDAVRDSDLDSTAKLIAYTISTYMDRNGAAFPAKATIAKKASLAVRTVDAAIVRLEASPYLSIRKSDYRRAGWTYQAEVPNRQQLPDRSEGNPASDDSQSGNSRRSNRQQLPPKAVESKKKAVNARKIEETCFNCNRPGPVIDNGFELLCEQCLEQSGKDVAF